MKKIVYSFAVFLFVLSFSHQAVSAEVTNPGCDQSASSQVSAFVRLGNNLDSIYARSPQLEAQGPSHLYFQIMSVDSAGMCFDLGAVDLNSSWQNVGQLPASVNGDGVLLLVLPDNAPNIGAGGPQIAFVDKDQRCDVVSKCPVIFEGIKFELIPKKISISSDTLRVGVFLPVQNDKIRKVIYSIDNKPAYETDIIEAFNERYVPGGIRKLTRTIVLSSGQSMIDSRQVENGSVTDPRLILQSYYYSQSKLILVLITISLLLLGWYLLLVLLRFKEKRRMWKQAHDATSKRTYDSTKVGAQNKFHEESFVGSLIRYRRWWIGFVGVIALFIVFSTYIVGTFTVDGVSMEPTLHDKSVHPLIKIQKSLSTVNRSEYVPSRGKIVVIEKDESNLFDSGVAQKKSYVVKRVVGLPGERITVKNGKMLVYNKEYPNGFEPDALFKWTAKLEGSEFFNIDITLKDSELFVVGDHRNESIDSRFYGPVNTNEVVGRVPE